MASRVPVAGGVAAAAVVPLVTVGPAAAAGVASVGLLLNEIFQVATWFFGHTSICFQDNNNDSWWVGQELHLHLGDVRPTHSQLCAPRSWVGIPITVGGGPASARALASETIHVSLPYGPFLDPV